MARFFLIAFLGFFGAARLFAADPAGELYKAASDAFRDKFYERAENQFGEFQTKFPDSTNAPMAILLQAEARYFQKKYPAAIDLLRKNASKAGGLADQYLYWEAEAFAANDDFAGAARAYREMLNQFPNSGMRLEASYSEAYALFQLKKFPETVDLLKAPNGAFQLAAKSRQTSPYAFRGALLLSEALLNLGRLDEARSAASGAAAIPNQPELEWERWILLARIDLAGSKPAGALSYVSNAVSSALAASKPQLQADAWNIEAEVYKKLNQPANAAAAYEKIAANSVLAQDQRRLAVLKTVELYSSTHNLTNAIARLETYLTANTNEPAADLLHVKAGELWIDRFRALAAKSSEPAPPATNALFQARTHLLAVINQFTNSTHLGRAWLNLGWSYWEEGTAYNIPARIQSSETAFQKAVEKLTRSDDQALAYFKMADAELALGNPLLASTNYLQVLRNYADLPPVRVALFEKCFRSLVRACIDAGDLPQARTYLDEFQRTFPNSQLAREATFAYGQALAMKGETGEARKVYQELLKNDPASPLVPEVRLAEARTFDRDGNWPSALKLDDDWLNTYTNHPMRPEVEFERGLLLDKSGSRTNAFILFTNFVTQFPTNRLAIAAQNWVADYYYEQEQWLIAEQNYQRVFQNTNWPADPLSYRAQMAAAKTAFRRQGYGDARAYLTNLINDPKCPQQLVPEALFELGDVCLEEPITGTTNNLNNFLEAAKAFDAIINQFPSNTLAVLAWGKKGDCLFQLGSNPNYAGSYVQATNAYQMVLNSKASIPVSARNQAEVGLGLVLKAMADGKPEAERISLLKAARDHFLNVVYSDARGPAPDPYYLKQAGLEAGRITRQLGETDAALHLYQTLIEKAPSLKVFWEARINALEP